MKRSWKRILAGFLAACIIFGDSSLVYAAESTQPVVETSEAGDVVVGDEILEETVADETDEIVTEEQPVAEETTEIVESESEEETEEDVLQDSSDNEMNVVEPTEEVVNAAATDSGAPETSVEEPEIIQISAQQEVYVNPLYEDVVSEEDILSEVSAVMPVEELDTYTNGEEIVEMVREELVARTETIAFAYEYEGVYDADGIMSLLVSYMDEAMKHTGNPKEGDYLKWNYAGNTYGISGGYSQGDKVYVELYYSMVYYTSAEMEAEMDEAVRILMNTLHLDNMSDYKQIKKIYDFICENVVYDYENLENEEYKLKYTPYAALINGTAVCQGYAMLFYRVALEAGIDARVITGDAGGPHAWNIVELEEQYYNLDSTWDAGRGTYSYFLKDMAGFTDHVRDEEYLSESFMAAYPMSETTYVEDGLGFAGTVQEDGDSEILFIRSWEMENASVEFTDENLLQILNKRIADGESFNQVVIQYPDNFNVVNKEVWNAVKTLMNSNERTAGFSFTNGNYMDENWFVSDMQTVTEDIVFDTSLSLGAENQYGSVSFANTKIPAGNVYIRFNTACWDGGARDDYAQFVAAFGTESCDLCLVKNGEVVEDSYVSYEYYSDGPGNDNLNLEVGNINNLEPHVVYELTKENTNISYTGTVVQEEDGETLYIRYWEVENEGGTFDDATILSALESWDRTFKQIMICYPEGYSTTIPADIWNAVIEHDDVDDSSNGFLFDGGMSMNVNWYVADMETAYGPVDLNASVIVAKDGTLGTVTLDNTENIPAMDAHVRFNSSKWKDDGGEVEKDDYQSIVDVFGQEDLVFDLVFNSQIISDREDRYEWYKSEDGAHYNINADICLFNVGDLEDGSYQMISKQYDFGDESDDTFILNKIYRTDISDCWEDLYYTYYFTPEEDGYYGVKGLLYSVYVYDSEHDWIDPSYCKNFSANEESYTIPEQYYYLEKGETYSFKLNIEVPAEQSKTYQLVRDVEGDTATELVIDGEAYSMQEGEEQLFVIKASEAGYYKFVVDGEEYEYKWHDIGSGYGYNDVYITITGPGLCYLWVRAQEELTIEMCSVEKQILKLNEEASLIPDKIVSYEVDIEDVDVLYLKSDAYYSEIIGFEAPDDAWWCSYELIKDVEGNEGFLVEIEDDVTKIAIFVDGRNIEDNSKILVTDTWEFESVIDQWTGTLTVPADSTAIYEYKGNVYGDFFISEPVGYDWSNAELSYVHCSDEVEMLWEEELDAISYKGYGYRYYDAQNVEDSHLIFKICNYTDEDLTFELKTNEDFSVWNLYDEGDGHTTVDMNENYYDYDNYNNFSYYRFVPEKTGLYNLYDGDWVYRVSDHKLLPRYNVILEAGEEYLIRFNDTYGMETTKAREYSGTEARFTEQEPIAIFSPTVSGDYYIEVPGTLKIWNEEILGFENITTQTMISLEAGETYIFWSRNGKGQIGLKNDITVLDYDYYQALIASGGSVSIVDGELQIKEPFFGGFALKEVLLSLLGLTPYGEQPREAFMKANQYWVGETGTFAASEYYRLSEDGTLTDCADDSVTAGDILVVKYEPEIVWVDSMEVSVENTVLSEGNTAQINVNVAPATEKYGFKEAPEIRFESSDPTIAEVDENGVVIPYKSGKVTITVYADETLRYQEGLEDQILSQSVELTVVGKEFTVLDYDFLHAFIASGGSVSLNADGSLKIEQKKAGWNLISMIASFFGMKTYEEIPAENYIEANHYWVTEKNESFVPTGYYDLNGNDISKEQAEAGGYAVVKYEPEYVWVDHFDMEVEDDVLTAGESTTLKVTPYAATEKYGFKAEPEIRLASTNPEVADVLSDGTIETYKSGTVLIKAYADETLKNEMGLGHTIVKDYVVITVEPAPVTFTYEILNDGTAGITGYEGVPSKVVEIPSEIDGYQVTAIGELAFLDCTDLDRVVLPDSIESIHDLAFKYQEEDDYLNLDIMFYASKESYAYGWAKDNGYKVMDPAEGPYSLDYEDNGDGTITITNYVGDLPSELVIPTEIDGYEVNGIGFTAFMGCEELTELVIPETVKIIDNAAFRGCTNLKKVTLPSEMVSLGAFAFGECIALEELILPNGITTLQNGVIWECDSLRSITLSDTIESIEYHAISHCDNLEEVIIPNSVMTISEYGIFNCPNLKEVQLPNSIESIGEFTFYQGDLEEDSETYERMDITIYASRKHYAYEWANDRGFTVVDSEESPYGFTYEMTDEDTVRIIGLDNGTATGNLVIPESIDGIKVTEVSGLSAENINGEFSGTLTLPSTLRVIHDNAFQGNEKLTGTVVIPSDVTYVGTDAFEGTALTIKVECEENSYLHDWAREHGYEYEIVRYVCDNFVYEVLEDNTAKILGCKEFDGDTLTIPAKLNGHAVSEIGDYAFENYENLCELRLECEETLKLIGNYAFRNCSSMWSFEIPENVVSIGDGAFYGTSDWWILEIPESVTSIGKEAFGNVGSIYRVYLSDKVTSIGENAFTTRNYNEDNKENILLYCAKGSYAYNWASKNGYNIYDTTAEREYQLTYTVLDEEAKTAAITGYTGEAGGTLTIPSTIDGYTVVEIADDAFDAEQNMEEDGMYGDSINFTGLELPDTLVRIGDQAFQSCKGLTGSLVIPDSVKEIGAIAFGWCNRLSGALIIPDTVEKIGSNAFNCCTGFTSLSLGTGLSQIEYYTFANCRNITGELVIPENITNIADGAFVNCFGLSEVHMPDTVTSIEGTCFYDEMTTERLDITIYGSRRYYPYQWAEEKGFDVVDTDADRYFILHEVIDEEAKTARITGIDGVAKDGLVIPSTIDGYTITEIADSAFNSVGTESKIVGTLTIPDTITGIGYNAFEDCDQITGDLVIPDSVTFVAPYAFSGCSGFNGTLTLSDNLIGIDANAFAGCSGFIGTLELPSALEIIDVNAFSGCSGFTGALVFPSKLETIGSGAFSGCSGFTGILSIPYATKNINDYAFFNCTGLEKINITPNTNENIADNAFTYDNVGSENDEYKDVILDIIIICEPDSYVYEWAKRLGYEVDTQAAFEARFTYKVLDDGTACITKYNGASCDYLEIPEKLGGYTVTQIGAGAFKDCTEIYGRIIVPETVKVIGDGAFEGVTGTDYVYLPDSLELLGEYVFRNCSNLMRVRYPETLNTIPDETFCGIAGYEGDTFIDQAEKLTIPEHIVTIGEKAYFNNSYLTRVVISDNVTSIGKDAFSKLDMYNNVINQEITFYCSKDSYAYNWALENGFNVFDTSSKGDYKFTYEVMEDGSAQITGYEGTPGCNLEIPSEIDGYTVTRIADSAFGNQRDFTGTLTLPDTLVEIGSYAFADSDGLTGDLILPDNLKIVGEGAFSCCYGFNGKLILSESLECIGSSAFSDCRGLKGKLNIPDTVTLIGTDAFISCEGFDTLQIGKGLDRVSMWAFNGLSGLKGTLIIPENIKMLEDYAFANCRNLTDVFIPESVTEINETAFGDDEDWDDEDYNLEITIHCIENSYAHTWAVEHGFDVALGNSYEVTLETYGGTINTGNLTNYTEGIETILPTDVTKDGYTFVGWYNNAGLSGKPITVIDKTQTGDLTFYAKWFLNEYQIEFEVKGGTIEGDVLTTYTIESESITLPTNVTKDAYTFAGWYDNVNFAGEKVTEIPTGSTGDKEFYAKWTAKVYDIIYHTDGGTLPEGTRTSYTVEFGTITFVNPTRMGYEFKGWYENSACIFGKVTEIPAGSMGDVEIYAKWEILEYNIDYELNGGINNPKNPTDYTVEDDVVLYDPIREGYEFLGWYDENGNKVTDVTKLAEDQKLHADWETKEYDITYNENGGTIKGDYVPNYTIESDKVVLPEIEKPHYEFEGWYTDETFSEQVTVIEKGSIGDRTFYAKWRAIEYSIEYVLNDDELNSAEHSNPHTYTIETDTFELTDASRRGYESFGWYSDEECTKQITEIEKGTARNLTVYAYWEPILYQIEYVFNTDDYELDTDYAVEYTVEDEVALVKPSRKGYDFAGWYLDESLKESAGEKIAVNTIGDQVFYAKWTPTKYYITYDVDGGKSVDSTEYTIETNTFELPTTTKEGYKFLGWSRDKNVLSEKVTAVEKGTVDDFTLYAHWEALEYKIEYNVNGGNEIADTVFTVESKEFDLTTPTKTGYDFAGWYINSKFTGTPVTEIAAGSTGDRIFYAKWIAKQYQITYEVNGGNVVADTTFTVESATFNLPKATRTGYTFAGWYLEPECKTQITKVEKGKYTDSFILYADWTENSYNITYVVNKGVLPEGAPATYGTSTGVEKLPEPTRRGYEFLGWYTTRNFRGEAIDSIAVGETGNKTIYANWERIDYPIYYELNDTEQDNNGDIISLATNAKGNPSTYHVESTTITLKAPTRDGYTFKGWYYWDMDQSKMVRIEKIVKGSFDHPLTLYCEWEPTEYNITYVLNSGAFETEVKKTYSIKDDTFVLEEPSRKGYEFAGWYTNAKFGEDYKVTGIEKKSTGNKTFYAKWTPIEYTIEYHNEDEISYANYTIESKAITLPVLKKAGYTFEGWYEAENGTGTPVNVIPAKSTENRTFYAKWSLIEYTIEYHNAEISDEIYTVESEVITLPVLEREGYVFEGWYATQNFKGEAIIEIAANSTGDKTFYAKWSLEEYAINFDLRADEKEVSFDFVLPETYDYETTVTLPEAYRFGYEFLGWFTTDENGNEEAIEVIESGNTGDISIYAKWKWSVDFVTEINTKSLNIEDKETVIPTIIVPYGETVNVNMSLTAIQEGHAIGHHVDTEDIQIVIAKGLYDEVVIEDDLNTEFKQNIINGSNEIGYDFEVNADKYVYVDENGNEVYYTVAMVISGDDYDKLYAPYASFRVKEAPQPLPINDSIGWSGISSLEKGLTYDDLVDLNQKYAGELIKKLFTPEGIEEADTSEFSNGTLTFIGVKNTGAVLKSGTYTIEYHYNGNGFYEASAEATLKINYGAFSAAGVEYKGLNPEEITLGMITDAGAIASPINGINATPYVSSLSMIPTFKTPWGDVLNADQLVEEGYQVTVNCVKVDKSAVITDDPDLEFAYSNDSCAVEITTKDINPTKTLTKTIYLETTITLPNTDASITIPTTIKNFKVYNGGSNAVESISWLREGDESWDALSYLYPMDNTQNRPISFKFTAKDYAGNPVDNMYGKVNWSTSNKAVATVSVNKTTGQPIITIPKKAQGVAEIKAVTTDAAKKEFSFRIVVADLGVRVENTKLTLNSKAVESVGIVNVYPNVLAQSLPKDPNNQETYSAAVKFVTSKGADDSVAESMFTVTNCIEESGEVKISFKGPQSLKKNHTVYLKVTQTIPGYGNRESSPIKVTISDKCALPTVSGKTTVNYNKAMAYTKAYAEVLVTTSEPLKNVSDLSTVLRLKESTVPVKIAANGIEKISDTQYRVKLLFTKEITETDYKNAKQFNVQFEALCEGYRDTEFCQSKQINVPVVSVAPTVVISTDVAMFYKETDMEFRNMKIDVDVPEDLTVKDITLTKDALKQFGTIGPVDQSGDSFVVTVRPNAKSSGGNIQFNIETEEYGTLTSTKLKVTGRSITAEAISLFDESTKQKAASSYTFYYSLLGKERIELKAESQYLSEIVNNYGGDIEIDVQPANTATATLLNKKAVVISTEGDKVVITATKDAFDPKLKSNTSCKLKIALKALDGTNVKNTKAQNITITFSPKSYNTTVALKAAANLNMAAKEPVVSVKPTIKYLPMGAKVERVTFKNTADEQKFAIIPGENGAFELGLAADGVEVPSGKNTIALTYDIRTVSGELTRIDTSVVVNVTQNAAIKLSTSNITLYNSVIGTEFAKTIEFTESKFGGKISVEIDEASREMLKDAGIRIVEEGKDSDYEDASDMKENVKYKVYVAEDLNRGQEKTYTVKAKVSLYNSATKKGVPITYNTSFKVKLAK